MRPKLLMLPVLAVIVVGGLALLLGQTGTVSAAKPGASVTINKKHVTIAISNYAFKPPTLTVHTGTRVTWKNHDSTAHTATADSGPFDTGSIDQGKSKTVDFKRAGTYRYHCSFHAFMTATIKVVR